MQSNSPSKTSTYAALAVVAVLAVAAFYFLSPKGDSGQRTPPANAARSSDSPESSAQGALPDAQLQGRAAAMEAHTSSAGSPESEDAPEPDLQPEDPSWIEAKEAMRVDFEMTEFMRNSVNKSVFSIKARHSSAVDRAFRLDQLDEVDWNEVLALPDGASLTAQQAEDLQFLAKEHAVAIEQAAADVSGLLGDALLEYWKHDMGKRERRSLATSNSEQPPKEYRGAFTTEFVASHGDWRVRVGFDSADFPVLETALTEAERLRLAFIAQLESIVQN